MTSDHKSSILHEKVTLDGGSPIKVKWNRIQHFTFPWHFHSEYEILYIIDGSGTRFVGESMEPFQSGDLVMVGSQLPHFWKSDEAYHQGDPTKLTSYIVLQFTQSFLNDSLHAYPELGHIKNLLMKAQQGILFQQPWSKILGDEIKGLYNLTGFERFIAFIDILNKMAQCDSIRLLSAREGNSLPTTAFSDRLNKLLYHINRNYKQKTSLTEIAQWYGMNTAAFSRYFKQKTGKTFVNYINEMRIAHACKLLQNGGIAITQACFECGFNNISNFNRSFKLLMKTTPSKYLERFNNAKITQLTHNEAEVAKNERPSPIDF